MEFTTLNIIILLIAFWWAGFIRAGLGFGGAGLMYPIAFLAVDSVLFIVPIVGIQLLFFAGITLAMGEYKKIDWKVVRWVLAIIMIPKLIGVFGLLQLPEFWVLMSVYVIIIIYSLTYIFGNHGQTEKKKPNKFLNGISLIFGGYVSGLTLSGAPIIAAAAIQYLKKEQVRASLYVIWIIAVTIKLSTLAAFNVDMQLEHQLWLLPIAAVGHVMGLRLHDKLISMKSQKFYRWMGIVLLTLSIIGLLKNIL